MKKKQSNQQQTRENKDKHQNYPQIVRYNPPSQRILCLRGLTNSHSKDYHRHSGLLILDSLCKFTRQVQY